MSLTVMAAYQDGNASVHDEEEGSGVAEETKELHQRAPMPIVPAGLNMKNMLAGSKVLKSSAPNATPQDEKQESVPMDFKSSLKKVGVGSSMGSSEHDKDKSAEVPNFLSNLKKTKKSQPSAEEVPKVTVVLILHLFCFHLSCAMCSIKRFFLVCLMFLCLRRR